MPPSSRPVDRLRAWMPAALVLTSLLVAGLAAWSAATLVPEADAVDVGQDQRVGHVLPGGQAWQAGVRPGQPALSLTFGPAPGAWRLEVADAQGTVRALTSEGELALLRQTLPLALVALLLAVLGLPLLPARRELAAAVALGGTALASVPVGATNSPFGSTLVLAGLPLATAAWLGVARVEPRVRVLAMGLVVVAAAWLVARLALPALFDLAESARQVATLAGLAVAIAAAAPWRSWAERRAAADAPRALDVASLAVLAGGIGLATAMQVPVPLIVVGAVSAAGAYLLARTRLAAIVEHLATDGIRARAMLAVAEEERSRIAGEIHDGPLQALGIVAAGLRDGGSREDALALLDEAGLELRAICAAMHPSVLDDLGLHAALGWLVHQVRVRLDADLDLRLALDDLAGRAGEVDGTGVARPPAAVELAVFRVAQEAISNAVVHAGASVIQVGGHVGARSVHLEIRDDGRGILPAELRAATRAGRLGLGGMRLRASSIGAQLRIAPVEPHGTVVSLTWSAS